MEETGHRPPAAASAGSGEVFELACLLPTKREPLNTYYVVKVSTVSESRGSVVGGFAGCYQLLRVHSFNDCTDDVRLTSHVNLNVAVTRLL